MCVQRQDIVHTSLEKYILPIGNSEEFVRKKLKYYQNSMYAGILLMALDEHHILSVIL